MFQREVNQAGVDAGSDTLIGCLLMRCRHLVSGYSARTLTLFLPWITMEEDVTCVQTVKQCN